MSRFAAVFIIIINAFVPKVTPPCDDAPRGYRFGCFAPVFLLLEMQFTRPVFLVPFLPRINACLASYFGSHLQKAHN